MRSLTLKMILAFLVVSLLGTALAATYVWRMTTSEFGLFVVSQYHNTIVERLAKAYQAQGSWEGISSQVYLDPLKPPPQETPSALPSNPAPSPFRYSPIAVADSEGRIVLAGLRYREGDLVSPADWQRATPIKVDGQEVGRLLVDPRRAEGGVPYDRFLTQFYLALGLGTLGGTLLALMLGVLWARSLTWPLRQLSQAAQAMSQGHLEQRIRVRSRDELGELARSFNQLSADLVKAQALRRQMTADIAHELRTPLGLILGYTEALNDGVLPPSPQTFHILHDETRRLTRLVEDLRTLSLSDAGELTLHPQMVPPGELLEAAVARHRLQATEAKIELTWEIGEDLPDIYGDPDRLAQVLDNLVQNALQHTPAGGHVRLRARCEGREVRLTVEDSGPGIAPEDLENIFERFYRADKARCRHDGGSGLGLAIARAIVTAHGGRIWAENAPGHGATFVIALPVMSA